MPEIAKMRSFVEEARQTRLSRRVFYGDFLILRLSEFSGLFFNNLNNKMQQLPSGVFH